MKPKSIIIAILYLLIVVSASIAKDHEILFPAKKGGLWGYINTGGEWVIKAKYFKAYPFTEGLAAVKEYSKWGYIDKRGEWVILPSFEQATPFEEGLASVVNNDRWGFIDNHGIFIIIPEYEKASSFSEGLAVVANNNHYRYINHLGDVVLDGAFLSASPFAEGLAKVSWENRSGFINSNGQLLVTHNYAGAGLFSEGLARVKIQSKWGYMDRNGNISIVPVFEKNGHFSEDMAAVSENGKWGFIDKKGDLVIKPRFESVSPFRLGYAVAKSSGKWGIIDPSGNWIVKPRFDDIGSAGKSASLKEDIKEHIQSAYATWKTKREFETSGQYAIRLQENQQYIMDSIAFTIIKDYGDKQLFSNKPSLGYYDADHEYFTIYAKGLLPASVAVPIEDARGFKKNWQQSNLSKTDYSIVGEYFMLANFTVEINGNIYYGINENTEDIVSGLAWVDEISIPQVTWNIEDDPTPDKNVRIAAKPGTSDVDFDIPDTGIGNKNTFALIIGNEDYQNEFTNDINAKYAATDAKVFGKYVNKTLGVPKKNITLLVNATAGQIKQSLTKMNKITKSYHGEAEIIFYYSGHGLRDEVSKKPYLLPVDVNGSDLSFAISLDDALQALVENPHTRLSVFLDTDFTGGGQKERWVVTIGTGGVRIRPKSPFVRGNVVLFSATSDEQEAFSYDEKAHGMFTYFLLKKLKESRGRVSYSELADYLEIQVSQNAIITNNKEQIPDVAVSPSLEEVWERFTPVTPYQTGVFISNKN